MGALTDYGENLLLGQLQASLYLALFTSAPGEAGGGTEVSGGGYARQPFTLSAASNGQRSNANLITFGPATTDWGTVTHGAIFDAATGGNMIWYGAAPQAKTVAVNDKIEIEAGMLVVSLD